MKGKNMFKGIVVLLALTVLTAGVVSGGARYDAGLDRLLIDEIGEFTTNNGIVIKNDIKMDGNDILHGSADTGALLLYGGSTKSTSNGAVVVISGATRGGNEGRLDFLSANINNSNSIITLQTPNTVPALTPRLTLNQGATPTIVVDSSVSSFEPSVNISVDLGSPLRSWDEGYINTGHIGHLVEAYYANPTYTYEIGDVVALDLEGVYEIKPVQSKSDRIIGIVAGLPYSIETNGTIYDIETHDIAIYGKYNNVKVKGQIEAGDVLVASDSVGVLTSMYDTAHPMWSSMMPASTNPNIYNSIALTLPNAGMAMENYNNLEVGIIKVVLGKP